MAIHPNQEVFFVDRILSDLKANVVRHIDAMKCGHQDICEYKRTAGIICGLEKAIAVAEELKEEIIRGNHAY